MINKTEYDKNNKSKSCDNYIRHK